MKKYCVSIPGFAIIMVCCLFAVFCLAGCADDPETDLSISEITITDIPVQIPINGKAGSNRVFKVYLNASDSDKESDPPIAKGVAFISSDGILNESSGTYSVKIKLQNPAGESDPDLDTGAWSGTATYFSIMISPQKLNSDGVNAIWAKGGTTLNKGKSSVSWGGLINFRNTLLGSKAEALFEGIIVKDTDDIDLD